MPTAQDLVTALQLAPHPEGGWYRETWRAPSPENGRSAASAIHFLLQSGERSHWHTVDAAEIWFWHAGDPLLLRTAEQGNGMVQTVTLGPDILAGQQPHGIVPAGSWQAAEPARAVHGYTLVSCVVAPAFTFEGFTLAPAGWQPGA